MTNVLPPPRQHPPDRGWISGVALPGTLASVRSAVGDSLALGAAVRLWLPPHAPSRDRAVDFGSQLPPTGPVEDFQLITHAQRTGLPFGLPQGLPEAGSLFAHRHLHVISHSFSSQFGVQENANAREC